MGVVTSSCTNKLLDISTILLNDVSLSTFTCFQKMNQRQHINTYKHIVVFSTVLLNDASPSTFNDSLKKYHYQHINHFS